MTEIFNNLLPSFISGMVLGLFDFTFLWVSVRYLLKLDHAALAMTASYLLRNLTVLVGFYFVMAGQWQRILACLAGFLLVRSFFVKHTRKMPRSVGVSEMGP